MKSKLSILSGFLLSLIIASPLLADDTEIYLGASATQGQSNVLFSVDTSGSMSAHVIDFSSVDASMDSAIPGHPKFNPLIEYDSGSTCRDDRAYETRNRFGSPLMPYVGNLNSSGSSNVISNNDCGDLSNTRFTNISCPAALLALTTKGYFVDTNNDCTGTTFDQLHVSGRFADFVRKLVNNDGEPIGVDANLDPDGTGQIPWNQFFVESRLDVVKDVLNDILDNNDQYNIKVGITRFNGGSGGYIAQPIQAIMTTDMSGNLIQNVANQTALRNTLNAFNPGGSTPLEESYTENYQYFAGARIFYGGLSPSSVKNGSNYISPITHACQKNSVLLLTDGDPTSDGGSGNYIEGLWDTAYSPATTNCNSSSGNGFCMDELAQVMAEQDIRTNDAAAPALVGPDGSVITTDTGIKQTVTTHTVGFFNNNQILADTAAAGQGISRLATSAADLKAVFAEALSQIIDTESTFTSAALSVNNFNRLTNLDDLYFSLFKPQREPLWIGNIKKFKLIDGVIVDKDGNSAVDPATGAFRNSSISYWTPSGVIDGNEVDKGGFANRLTVNRNLYSNLSSTADLSSSANIVSSSNISPTDFGLTAGDTAGQSELIDWMYATTTDMLGNVTSTQTLGDVLHTTPVVLTYGATKTTTGGVTSTSFDQAIYFGTNSGFLHSIDPTPNSTGSMENFSFYPKSLIGKVEAYKNNSASTGITKLYGLDGPITGRIEGDDGDRVIETGEIAHIYTTMRRGGRNIYALDVTSRTAPKFDWQITGGDATKGFEELGQTWSKVTHATIPFGASTKEVLIFAGGYDADQDTAAVRTVDDVGRAIYIVEATGTNAGKLLWRAVPTTASDAPTGATQLKLAKMKYSIPSDVSAIDVNSDGIADRLYVGDMGGQIWRFDFSPGLAGTGFNISGDVIADLASDNSTANNRRFYYPPSVSRVTDDAFGSYIAIAIGSGKRAKPTATGTNDKFYMIKDPYVFQPKTVGSPAVPSYDYMTVGGGFGTIVDNGTAIKDITTNANPDVGNIGVFGWSISLGTSGEKVLASASTADNKIFFTTYFPGSSTGTTTCDPAGSLGSGRLYAVSVLTGSPVFASNANNSTDLSDTYIDLSGAGASDRYVDLVSPGIPPAPQLLISSGSSSQPKPPGCMSPTTANLLVGNETFIPPICTAPVKTYWHRYEK